MVVRGIENVFESTQVPALRVTILSCGASVIHTPLEPWMPSRRTIDWLLVSVLIVYVKVKLAPGIAATGEKLFPIIVGAA